MPRMIQSYALVPLACPTKPRSAGRSRAERLLQSAEFDIEKICASSFLFDIHSGSIFCE